MQDTMFCTLLHLRRRGTEYNSVFAKAGGESRKSVRMLTKISEKADLKGGRIDLRTPFPETDFEPATLVDLLRWRATHQPRRRAYTFLGDWEADERSVDYGELDLQ